MGGDLKKFSVRLRKFASLFFYTCFLSTVTLLQQENDGRED